MRTRSPFPGMDPWLESYWTSIHHRIISDFADQVRGQLPEGLFADIEVTVYIADDEVDRGIAVPDVAVLDTAPLWDMPAKSAADSNLAVATPFRIKLPAEPVEQGHVVIRSLKDNQPLVTVIEVLSPTNKIDRRGRAAYIAKREEYYLARANLVEADFLRRGAELIDVPFDEVPVQLLTPYKAVVRRAFPRDRTQAEYDALPLREPLPRIAVPLRRKDPDIVLDLQRAVDRAYDGGSYGMRIDYSKPPSPPLSPEDGAWAAERVSAPM